MPKPNLRQIDIKSFTVKLNQDEKFKDQKPYVKRSKEEDTMVFVNEKDKKDITIDKTNKRSRPEIHLYDDGNKECMKKIRDLINNDRIIEISLSDVQNQSCGFTGYVPGSDSEDDENVPEGEWKRRITKEVASQKKKTTDSLAIYYLGNNEKKEKLDWCRGLLKGINGICRWKPKHVYIIDRTDSQLVEEILRWYNKYIVEEY
jgi:hypothetical protein